MLDTSVLKTVLISTYRDAWQYLRDCMRFGNPEFEYASWDNAGQRMAEIEKAMPDFDFKALKKEWLRLEREDAIDFMNNDPFEGIEIDLETPVPDVEVLYDAQRKDPDRDKWIDYLSEHNGFYAKELESLTDKQLYEAFDRIDGAGEFDRGYRISDVAVKYKLRLKDTDYEPGVRLPNGHIFEMDDDPDIADNCESTNHPHTECYGRLYVCAGCHKHFCYADGAAGEYPELCDTCWSKQPFHRFDKVRVLIDLSEGYVWGEYEKYRILIPKGAEGEIVEPLVGKESAKVLFSTASTPVTVLHQHLEKIDG